MVKRKKAAAKSDKGKSAGGGKRGRKPPPPNETKRDRFVRIATERTRKAIHAIELLGNLASPHYSWEPRDQEAMVNALLDAVDRTAARFEAKAPRPKGLPEFTIN